MTERCSLTNSFIKNAVLPGFPQITLSPSVVWLLSERVSCLYTCLYFQGWDSTMLFIAIVSSLNSPFHSHFLNEHSYENSFDVWFVYCVESNFGTTETTYNLLNISTSSVTGILALDLLNNIGEIIGMCSVAANSGWHNSKNFKIGSSKSVFLCQ